MFIRPHLLAVLIPLALAGCATQEALTEQSTSAQSRLDRLEQSIRALADLGEARQAAQAAEIAGLRAAIQDLGERVGRVDAGLDRLGQASRAADEQGAAERRQLAERLDALARQAGGAADQAETARLAARLAQAEARLDGLPAGLAERLARAETRLDGLAGSVDEALALARQEQIRLNGKEAFTVLLTEDRTLYPINSPDLGGQDVGKLDDLIRRLAGLGQEYHLEIQGHTDNIGTEDYNYELGKARADVVKRYLHERKGIPLSQMSVISFGAASPVDRNSQRNRRIVVRVLVAK